VAERVCGELSRAVPGRMLEPGATVDLDGSAGGGGRLPAEIQPGEAAQPAGLRKSGGFCGAELSSPSSGRAAPSLRWGWTTNKQKHKLNHVPRLTHGLDQKSEPGKAAKIRQHLRVAERVGGRIQPQIISYKEHGYIDRSLPPIRCKRRNLSISNVFG
jgi:hypothetical protein